MRAIATDASAKLSRVLAGGLCPQTVTARGNTLLEEAWSRSSQSALEILMAAGASPTWVMLANAWKLERSGHAKPSLVRHFEQVLARTRPGSSPGLRSLVRVANCPVETIPRLLALGMPVEVVENFRNLLPWSGKRLLSIALSSRRPEVVAILLDAGATPDQVSSDGIPPLVMAAANHDAASIRSLLASGANGILVHPDSGLSVASLALLSSIPLNSADPWSSREAPPTEWVAPPAPSTPEGWQEMVEAQSLLLLAGASWDDVVPVGWLSTALCSYMAPRNAAQEVSLYAVRTRLPRVVQERWMAAEISKALEPPAAIASRPSSRF